MDTNVLFGFFLVNRTRSQLAQRLLNETCRNVDSQRQ